MEYSALCTIYHLYKCSKSEVVLRIGGYFQSKLNQKVCTNHALIKLKSPHICEDLFSLRRSAVSFFK